MITRRQALALAGAAPAWLASTSSAAPAPGSPRMGGTPTAFSIHSAAARRSGQQFDLTEYFHGLGLGGSKRSAIRPDRVLSRPRPRRRRGAGPAGYRSGGGQAIPRENRELQHVPGLQSAAPG